MDSNAHTEHTTVLHVLLDARDLMNSRYKMIPYRIQHGVHFCPIAMFQTVMLTSAPYYSPDRGSSHPHIHILFEITTRERTLVERIAVDTKGLLIRLIKPVTGANKLASARGLFRIHRAQNLGRQ